MPTPSDGLKGRDARLLARHVLRRARGSKNLMVAVFSDPAGPLIVDYPSTRADYHAGVRQLLGIYDAGCVETWIEDDLIWANLAFTS